MALGTARGPQGVAPRDIETHPLPLESIFFKVLIRKLAFSDSFNDLTDDLMKSLAGGILCSWASRPPGKAMGPLRVAPRDIENYFGTLKSIFFMI